MRAAIYNGKRDVSVKEIASPAINDFQVLVDVEACGICGSDLHTYREDWQPEKNVTAYPEGRVLGHEYAGTVTAVGKSVATASVGDRVVGISIGGGMAQQVAVFDSPFTLRQIPDGVSFAAAATTEPMANALRIVRLSDPAPGENVVVFGTGIIGLGVIQAYRALGVELGKLIAVDTSDVRLDMARQVGADFVINAADSSKGTVVDQVVGICDQAQTVLGEPAPNVDIVVDCVGYISRMAGTPVIQTALDLITDRTGRIMCFGIFEDDVKLNLHNLIFKQPKLTGVMGYDAEDLAEALAMMADGRIDRQSLVTHRYPIDQVADAFEAQDDYADSIKVVVLPQPNPQP